MLAVRTGPGGVAQQRAESGLLATVYLHYELCAGGPMLHEHTVISPRVKGPDGRWRDLDSRLLLREVVAASELFNQRSLELICSRLGLGAHTNCLYVHIEDGDRLDDVLTQIAARRRAQLSATGSITALQNGIGAPGQLSAEFADAAERATTVRLTGLLERTLGAGWAAWFMAADAYPALIRALHDAERAGFDLPRLLHRTVPRRGFADADDPAAVLTWRLRERLKDAAQAQHETRPPPSGRAHTGPAAHAGRHTRLGRRLPRSHPSRHPRALGHASRRASPHPGPLPGRPRPHAGRSPARLGPPARSPAAHQSPPRRRHVWATTCALVELWRTRHAITSLPGLGPRPADPTDAAAWDDLDARVRALTRRRRPPHHLPPPDAPAAVLIEAALSHLDTPPPPCPTTPPCATLLAPHPCPTVRCTHARPGAPWPPSSPANPCPNRGWKPSLPPATTTRARTSSAPTPDSSPPSATTGAATTAPALTCSTRGPKDSTPRNGTHLTDAIDLYAHARVEHRLEQIRTRTAAARAAVLAPATPPLGEQPRPDTHRPGQRPSDPMKKGTAMNGTRLTLPHRLRPRGRQLPALAALAQHRLGPRALHRCTRPAARWL
ncbi:relaxase domain-containing protein [Streptomyces werraensis]|uniref:relaxase domain-containing protein n=1 Tax=Streptomyces werraensis TaxID=68284 RepID=UPI00381FCA8B